MNKKNFHILVVDDDNRIRELVKQYLQENNFIVTTAKDSLDAKKKIEIIKFDILILDIMMPGESGLSLTKEIKSKEKTPIILLTAKGETHDRIEGLELGADDYLGKPFEPKELLLRIKNILNKTRTPSLPEKIYIGNALINLKKLNIKINNQIKKINPKEKINTPIILLTAKGEAEERIEGLEVGADDYLPKPFEPKELILRIKNILNKTKNKYQKRFVEFDNIKIDLNKLIIIKNNSEFKINNTEKIILEKMINAPGETFSRESIGNLIDIDKERSVDVIITRLRKKIEIDPKNPKYLQTIRGAGYVLWVE